LAEAREPWRKALDELDRQLVRSHPEHGLGNEPSGIWSMDVLRRSFGELGMIPEHLVPRAARILADYDAAFVRINAAKHMVGAHLDMLQTVRGQVVAGPVYLDRVG
jgi:hypothetical protein